MNSTNLAGTNSSVPEATVNFASEPFWSEIIRYCLSAMIFFIGVTGNCMVCFVVYQNQRMQTAMNFFLVSLAITDTFVCLINIPFTLIYWKIQIWPFGLAWCKILPTLQMTMISASTGSLIAVTIERYRAICMPFSPALSRLQARLMIVLVWLVSFLVALPELGAYVIIDTPIFPCQEIFPDVKIRQAYSLFLLLAMYVLPLLLIFPAYARMIWKLWKSERNQETSIGGCIQDPKAHKRKKNVIKMMVIVVTTYAICLMPYHAIWLWSDYGTGSTWPPFWIALNYFQILSWFNSCINPVVYWALSEQFSKGFSKILGCYKCKLNKKWTRRMSFTHSSSDPPNQIAAHHNGHTTRDTLVTTVPKGHSV